MKLKIFWKHQKIETLILKWAKVRKATADRRRNNSWTTSFWKCSQGINKENVSFRVNAFFIFRFKNEDTPCRWWWKQTFLCTDSRNAGGCRVPGVTQKQHRHPCFDLTHGQQRFHPKKQRRPGRTWLPVDRRASLPSRDCTQFKCPGGGEWWSKSWEDKLNVGKKRSQKTAQPHSGFCKECAGLCLSEGGPPGCWPSGGLMALALLSSVLLAILMFLSWTCIAFQWIYFSF